MLVACVSRVWLILKALINPIPQICLLFECHECPEVVEFPPRSSTLVMFSIEFAALRPSLKFSDRGAELSIRYCVAMLCSISTACR